MLERSFFSHLFCNYSDPPIRMDSHHPLAPSNMKFILPPAILAGIISVASLPATDAQPYGSDIAANLTYERTWYINEGKMFEDKSQECSDYACADFQGGGIIDGNNLLIVGCAEFPDAKLYKIPLVRDCK